MGTCDLRCTSLQDVNRQLAAHPGKKIPKGWSPIIALKFKTYPWLLLYLSLKVDFLFQSFPFITVSLVKEDKGITFFLFPIFSIIEAGRFTKTMEIWFWSLPSNRFTDTPADLLYSQKKASLTLLNEFRSGSLTLQEASEAIIQEIIGKRFPSMDQELSSFAR